MKQFAGFTLSTLLALSSSTTVAAPEIRPVELSRPNVMAFHLESQILNQTMLIEVALPLSYGYTDSSTNYPISYTGDGVLTFLMASTDNIRASFNGSFAPETITVGFDFADSYDACARSQWYTPTAISDDEECGEVGGGAEQYLAFIRDELKPFINQTFRADQSKEVIAGHSHTATLALFALFTQPDLFDSYIAASPSLYWDNEVMYQYQQAFADNYQLLDKPVYISVGLKEAGAAFADQQTTDWANQTVFSYVYRMGRKLKQDFPDAPIKLQAFANEDHGSVAGKAFHQGIHFVMTGE